MREHRKTLREQKPQRFPVFYDNNMWLKEEKKIKQEKQRDKPKIMQEDLKMCHDDYFDRKERHLEKYAILTPLDVMDILGIGKNSVYALLNSGKLRGFRVGRSWRVTTDALEEFMLSGH